MPGERVRLENENEAGAPFIVGSRITLKALRANSYSALLRHGSFRGPTRDHWRHDEHPSSPPAEWLANGLVASRSCAWGTANAFTS